MPIRDRNCTMSDGCVGHEFTGMGTLRPLLGGVVHKLASPTASDNM
jgi:hypothetical protein